LFAIDYSTIFILTRLSQRRIEKKFSAAVFVMMLTLWRYTICNC